MIHKTHNFKADFANANGVKDVQLQGDMIMSALARNIVRNQDKVADAIRDAGIKLPENPTQRQLIAAITKNAGENAKLKKNLSVLILKVEPTKKSGDKVFNAEGDFQAGANAAASIFNALGSIFGKNKNQGGSNQQYQPPRNQTPQQQLGGYVHQMQNRPPTGLSTGAIVGIVIGGIGLLSLIAILITKKRG